MTSTETTPEGEIDLDAIIARARAATPGPWKWRGNHDSQHVYLESAEAPHRWFVMDFTRWGMQGAAPRFRNGENYMVRADANIVYAVCQEATTRGDHRVYRGDIVGIRHPDAEFIAHARADIDALIAEVKRLRRTES